MGRRYKEQRTLRTRTQSRTRRQTKLDGCSNLLTKPSDRGAPQDNNIDVQRPPVWPSTDPPSREQKRVGQKRVGNSDRPTHLSSARPWDAYHTFNLAPPVRTTLTQAVSNCRFEASPFFRHRQSSRRTVAVPLPAAANNLATHCMRCVERRCHQFARAVAWYVQGA